MNRLAFSIHLVINLAEVKFKFNNYENRYYNWSHWRLGWRSS